MREQLSRKSEKGTCNKYVGWTDYFQCFIYVIWQDKSTAKLPAVTIYWVRRRKRMFFEWLVLGKEEGGGLPPLASRQLR
jgi:hypothetical protein